jgi:hypothetical protein
VLKSAGFQRVDARNGWLWDTPKISVFNIRSVGRSISEVTGWPPGSVCVWLGVYFEFIPSPTPDEMKTDKDGGILPAEHHCHLRTHLERKVRQARFTRRLQIRVEKRRRDIWWVEPDGSNAEEVATDIASVLSKKGLPWFRQCGDPATALRIIEKETDCLAKYQRAAHLAHHLGHRAKTGKYLALQESEIDRIGLTRTRGERLNKR